MTVRRGDRGEAASGTAAPTTLPCRRVLGMRVDHIESDRAARLIAEWAAAAPGRGRMVCAANVHMTMQAHDDPAFGALVNAADLVLPDGVPMVWALRALGLPQRRRVRVTPDLLLELFVACEARGVKVGLYGGTPQTLADFVALLAQAVPGLTIPYASSPPFRAPTPQEDYGATSEIRDAGVQLLLVGIGCPKQERWMAAHADRLDCVMFGVGAAFDMFAGKTGNAPAWTHDLGLEWVYRLATEPRRLWRRYLLGNPRFVALFALQLARERRHR
jgi:N-acetylglucosaminyldiphosphoundecaprenol N-acetyl-beta-D-mannosaminyltransferase